MKGKFRILGRIGLGVFMVCALMLAFMPVAPVSAVTEVTDVWMDFPMSDAPNVYSDPTNIYIVHFKATTALLRGVDYVTVTFPDGSEAMGGDGTSDYAFSITDASIADSEVTFSTDYGTAIDTQDLAIDGPTWNRTTDVTGGGYRVKAKLPVDIAAGQDVWVKFDTTDGIEAAATEASTYKVYVSTTKDTTPVLSNKFALGVTSVTATDVETSYPLPATAGATATYIISFIPVDTVSLSTGKVTVKFPIGTTVPSSLAITDVSFSAAGTTFTSTPETPVCNVNTREVTAITPIDLTNTSADWFIQIKGIGNPTIAAAAHASTYSVMVRTSADGQYDLDSSGYAITAGSPSQILVANGEIGNPTSIYSDDATMVDIYSSQIYLGVADQYGNAKDPESAVTVNLSSSSGGLFYWSDTYLNLEVGSVTSCTSVSVDEQDPNHSDGDQIVYYKSGTAGTHTLTFSATDYPDVEWTFSVVPGVSVYDSSDTLVKTYAPLASAPPAETGDGSPYVEKYSGDYIADAISGSMAGDTIKLGDGIYEQDTVITLNKKVTLTSVNGASYTTLRPTQEDLTSAVDGTNSASLNVTADGTSTNPIIIDGLTFTRLRGGTEFDSAVHNDGYDYVTVRNCVFNYIDPDNNQQYEAVVYYRCHESGNITSATVSNNTFNNCCATWPNPSAGITANILFTASSTTNQFSGVTISGNTLTNCNGYGVTMQGCSGYLITGNIKDNTLTNPDRGIYISDWTHLTTGASVTGNTITGAYNKALRVEGSNNGPITIKNNTITGCVVGSYGAVSIEAVQYISAYKYVYVQYNDIYDNSTPYAISVDSADSDTYQYIDCRYNWFGDASGPYYSAVSGATVAKSNPNGTGDAVSDNVWYYPWLHKPLADVVADNVSWQTSTMKLVAGWNTLSTPVPLIAAADTVDELIPSGMSIGYYYDGGWTQITAGYTLSPCDAVYVKMDEVKYVQLKFECETFSTPSKDLAVGWNLISLASLASSGMYDLYAVASVYKDSANLPGYAQVISPSLNATRYDMYYNAGTSWAFSSGQTYTNYMYAGMGYWCYMQNACTLAGFEITPIAPDLD